MHYKNEENPPGRVDTRGAQWVPQVHKTDLLRTAMQLSRVPQSSAVGAVGEPPPKGPAPQTHLSPLSPIFHPEKVWLMNVRLQPLCLLQQKQQLDSFTLTPGPTALRDLKGRRRRNPRLRDPGLLLSSADEDVCVCVCRWWSAG